MTLSTGVAGQAGSVSPALATSAAKTNTRMLAIDALRGFVMLLMLIDHVMHAQRELVEVLHTLRQVVCVKG